MKSATISGAPSTSMSVPINLGELHVSLQICKFELGRAGFLIVHADVSHPKGFFCTQSYTTVVAPRGLQFRLSFQTVDASTLRVLATRFSSFICAGNLLFKFTQTSCPHTSTIIFASST